MHNQGMPEKEKLLEWIGSSYRDLMALPADALAKELRNEKAAR